MTCKDMVLTDRNIETIPHDMLLKVAMRCGCISYYELLVETMIFPILGINMNFRQERPGWFLCPFLTLRLSQTMQSILKDLERPHDWAQPLNVLTISRKMLSSGKIQAYQV